MAKREILLLGHENLYKISRFLTKDQLKKAKKIITDLHDTIIAFKETYNYGRAIAAPQTDEAYRVIYLHLGDQQVHFINPVMEPVVRHRNSGPLGQDIYIRF